MLFMYNMIVVAWTLMELRVITALVVSVRIMQAV